MATSNASEYYRLLRERLEQARDLGNGLTHQQILDLLDEFPEETTGGGGPGEED